MVDYKIHWLKMMSVPESRAVVGRHDGINGRDRERHLVRRSDIDWHTPSGRPRFPGGDFDTAVRALIETRFAGPRRRLVIAAQRSEHATYLEAGHAWDEIARVVGAPFWATTEPDRVFKAI